MRVSVGTSLVPRLVAAFFLSLLLAASGGQANPVTSADAQTAVSRWLAMDNQPLAASLSQSVREVRTYADDQGAPLYYVVCLNPSGYVILPADDLVEPIIAFSPEGDYEPVPENPLYALVVNDLIGRVGRARSLQRGPTYAPEGEELTANLKWARLLADAPPPVEGLSSISDPRVDPLVVSKWSQTTEGSGACYNYYTPPGPDGSASNYPCGCVATAMAQLMRYWQYPTSGIGVQSFTIYVCGSSRSASTRGGNGSGGPYSWADMPLDPDSGTTTAQRQAIGALCYDAGVAVNMNYCSGGSGADTLYTATAFRNTFGYSHAHRGYNSGSDLPAEPRNRMINANLHIDCPVILGITGPAGGHAVVCDGYGYNASTMYHHLNLGWAGSHTAWYNLPNIDSSPSFNSVYKCVYNIFTTGAGEAIAGRVTDSGGNPISGAIVTAGSFTDTTDSRGLYGLKVASSTSYTVSVSKPGYTFTSQAVTTGNSTDNTTTCGNKWPIDFVGNAALDPPSDPGATNVTTSSIRWTWTDNSYNETGFKVYADQSACPPVTLRQTVAANTTYWDYTSLVANCQHCFQVAATYAEGDSAKTSCIAAYTLAGPPSQGNNVTCDKPAGTWYPSGATFTFSNPAAFGTCGQYKASKFKYAWDTSPTRAWTGSESDWSAGSLQRSASSAGSYYLHLRSYNADGVANTTSLDLGPYKIDADAPSSPVVTDDGAFQTDTTRLHAVWTPSSDSSSGVCGYEYAIGTSRTDPGSGYVVAWKPTANCEATETGLALQYGVNYYWYMRAKDCVGNRSAIAASDGIAVVQNVPVSVAAAKMLPDGSSVGLFSKPVSAVFDDAFYIQDSDRPVGIRVEADGLPAGLAANILVDVGGKILTNSDGETLLQACVFNRETLHRVYPIGMGNRSVGGGDWQYDAGTGAGEQGVAGGFGLNNIGLLVRTWGKVVDDGSHPVIHSWSLDSDPGWTKQGEWAYGTPAGGGGIANGYPDPTSGHTGSSVFGVNLSGDYSTTPGGPWYLTTGAIDCTGRTGVHLHFWRWLNTDYQPYVYATVEASNNGASWTTIWNNGAAEIADRAWKLLTCDLSAIADGQATIYVRWGYEVRAGAFPYSGWNIDDVQVTARSRLVRIDDGSGVGVLVVYPPGQDLPAAGAWVAVTGVVSCERDPGGSVQPVILALP